MAQCLKLRRQKHVECQRRRTVVRPLNMGEGAQDDA